MLLNQFAKLVKRSHQCRVVHVGGGGGMWLTAGNAIYRAVGVPMIQTDQEMRTILNISLSKWDKTMFKIDTVENPGNVYGLDLTEYGSRDQSTRPMRMWVSYEGQWHSGLETRDGEMIFFDPSLTGPVEDVLAGEHGEIVVRSKADGGKYLVVRDGMEAVAAFLPQNVLNQEFVADLGDFYAACTAQLVHQREDPQNLDDQE